MIVHSGLPLSETANTANNLSKITLISNNNKYLSSKTIARCTIENPVIKRILE